jgi:hypothetical protein
MDDSQAIAFICSHTIVYVAMKSRIPSPLWCDTSSTRVTSRSQISQLATVNLIHFLVIPFAIPVLTRGNQFWLISPVWTRHVHSVPVNPCNHSTLKNLFVFTHGLKPGFFFSLLFLQNFQYITKLSRIYARKKNRKISLFLK